MDKKTLLADLRNMSAHDFLAAHLFDRIPEAFPDRSTYILWKSSLATSIDVDPAAITIVGSAALGMSLNPYKNFKEFDESSDVDVAVISSHHFQIAWRYLRMSVMKNHRLTRQQKEAIEDHRKRLIYWGTIGAERLLPLFPFAGDWLPAIAKASSPMVGNREVTIRIYADYEALRAYQVQSVQEAKNALLVAG